jgi:RNA polymerase sigma-70 factor (ECF subfamily)
MQSAQAQAKPAFNEQQTIQRAVGQQTGWQQAFADLVTQHQDYLLARCARYLGNTEDAADVVQEVFFTAHRHLAGFEGRSSLKTWLTRIADNQCHAYRRKQQRYVLVEDIDSMLEASAEAWSCMQDQDAETAEGLLRQLPDKAREVLGMRYWGDMSTDEMANLLGIGRSAVKMRTQRAVKECRQLLQAGLANAA